MKTKVKLYKHRKLVIPITPKRETLVLRLSIRKGKCYLRSGIHRVGKKEYDCVFIVDNAITGKNHSF